MGQIRTITLALGMFTLACSPARISDPRLDPQPGIVTESAAVPSATAGAAAPAGMGTAGSPPPTTIAPITPVPAGSPAPVTAGTAGTPAAPATPSTSPDSGGPQAGNWIGFGGGLDQTFARTDAQIDRSNLMMLGAAWEKTAPGGVTGTPAIYDGVVFWTDWVGSVHADKIADGTPVWSKKYERGFTSSPFVSADKVYLSSRDNMVYALDRATGAEIWATPITDNELAQLWSSPTVADGVVIVGIGGKGTSDGGFPYSSEMLMSFRGGVVGLDAETGQVRWHFENTIDAKGMMYGPGVSSWSSAAVDTVRKIAYIGTGNSYYSPASPYSDSLLALDYMTTEPKGHLVWSQQYTKNDNFTSGSPLGPDSDVGATPNLYTLDGKDYVAVGDKGGHFYIHDRETGQLIESVPLGTGSSTGGIMAPAAYADGKLYVTSNSSGSTVAARVNGKTGEVEWSATVRSGVSFGAPLLLKDVFLIGTTDSFPSARARPAEIVALDRETGTLVQGFSLPIKHQRGGGMSVFQNTLFISYGFVFENSSAESTLSGGLLAAAIGGKVIDTPTDGPVATYNPTYSAIYDEIFDAQGCGADRCHGGLGILLNAKATGYSNLIDGVGTMGCVGMRFVVPGQPMESLLYRKLADAMPPCGARMPLSLAPLKPEELAQVRTWIEMGAPNN
jgi:polyvinyl alcohol dehydrogenase (cytochrome)